MSEVVILKTTNGDEIITKVISNTGEEFKVSKPRVLVMMQGPNGESQPALAPWLVSAPDADVTILNSIMAVIAAPLDVERAYLQRTSGIALS